MRRDQDRSAPAEGGRRKAGPIPAFIVWRLARRDSLGRLERQNGKEKKDEQGGRGGRIWSPAS
jgi:hypothetical protein